MKREIDNDAVHTALLGERPLLAFDELRDYGEWRAKVKDALTRLLGMAEIEKNACADNFLVEEEEKMEGYTRIRYSFESEKGCFVPCYILIPDGIQPGEKRPVCICLQGHSTGFHNSVGIAKYDQDAPFIAERNGAYALRAVKQGYIALCVEQRGMGERTTLQARRGAQPTCGCYYTAMTALMLGRTVMGERVWDISRAIDTLSHFPAADTRKICCTGNSGGGTATFYAACLDERIRYALPSCCICTYRDSIGDTWHCSCNFVPGTAKYFDMGDLACLVAPRRMTVFTGIKDEIFPIAGTREVCDVMRRVYDKAGAAGRFRLVENDAGHFFDADKVFSEIERFLAE